MKTLVTTNKDFYDMKIENIKDMIEYYIQLLFIEISSEDDTSMLEIKHYLKSFTDNIYAVKKIVNNKSNKKYECITVDLFDILNAEKLILIKQSEFINAEK